MDNHKDQPNEVLAKSLEDPKMSTCLNNCNNCSDRLQEFESVGLQVAGLHKQVASLNRVIDRVNTVLESVCRILITNEGLYSHADASLEKILTEFSSILEDNNRENTISNLQHKLAEVTKDRDELKRNYPLIVEQQQKTHDTNNENLSPSDIENHVQSVEHPINTPCINANSFCELDNSVGELPTINAPKERQRMNYSNEENREFVKPSNSANYHPLRNLANIGVINKNKCRKPTQHAGKKSFLYLRTRHRQSPNLVEWQNYLQLVYSRTRSSASMNHQLINPPPPPHPKSHPSPLMDIQCYPVKPLPRKLRKEDQLNWFQFYY